MDLQVVLKPGKQVELNVKDADGNTNKLKTLLESGYNGETFGVISPIHEGNYYPLHPNDKLDVTFDVILDESGKKKEVYSMKVMVLERKKIDGQSVIILSKLSSPKKIQRRQTYRLHILKHITYNYLGNTKDILLKNISATGLRGIIEEKIPFDTEIFITLDLELEEKNEHMRIKCRVINCDPVANSMIQFDLRLQFLELTSAEKNKITNFIFRKQSESIRKTLDGEGKSKLYELIYGYTDNKRSGDDFIVRTVPILGLLTWLITLSIFALVVEARPETRYNLDQFFNYYKRGYWRADLLNVAFAASIFESIICTVGLYMNSKRMKRDGDQYNRGLIINLIFSVLIIFLYIVLPIGR